MEVRLATPKDLETLVRLRLDFFADMGWEKEAKDPGFEAALRAYLQQQLGGDAFYAALAFEDGQAVGSAFASLQQRPPKPQNPSGRSMHVTSVFVAPQHRGRGLATALMQAVIEEARRRGHTMVDLEATAAGQPVYARLGFEVGGCTPMVLKL